VRAMQCTQFCAKNAKNDLKPKDFLKWREYVCATQRKGGGTGELVTDEPVEVQSFKETTGHLKGIYRIYPKRLDVRKDVNMSQVGLRNTRILTDCAQKSA
jgi:hypothetical protein